MNKKLLGILIIICSFLIFAGVVYLIFFDKADTREEKPEEVEQGLPKEIGQNKDQGSIKPVEREKKTIIYNDLGEEEISLGEVDLKRMAAFFAERFGSYSNQSNFSNIDDLKIFMSRRMQKWSENFVKEALGKGFNPLYYSITTKSIFQEVSRFDDDVGVAKILVKTQRREATGSTNNTSSFYQDILISFIKENGAWKVDSANWVEQ